MYEVEQSKQFKKSLRRAFKQGKDLNKLYDVVDLLKSGEPVTFKYHNHTLKGDRLRGLQKLHIEPDWLLIYQIFDRELILYLVDTGSHASILGM